jgi:hypothetical protein
MGLRVQVNPAVDPKGKQGKIGSNVSPRSALAVGHALSVHSISPAEPLPWRPGGGAR